MEAMLLITINDGSICFSDNRFNHLERYKCAGPPAVLHSLLAFTFFLRKVKENVEEREEKKG